MREPKQQSRQGVSDLIVNLVRNNPGSEETYRPALADLLRDPNPEVRLHAASVLAEFPGPKELSALSELITFLNLPALQDSHFFDPIPLGGGSFQMQELEARVNEIRQFTAVRGLKAFGPDARDSVPWLETLA